MAVGVNGLPESRHILGLYFDRQLLFAVQLAVGLAQAYPPSGVRFYNWTSDERVNSEEDSRLGIDNFSRHGSLGRGVLLDVASHLAARGAPFDAYDRFEIPLSLLQEVASAQGVAIRPGDIVMFRTG